MGKKRLILAKIAGLISYSGFEDLHRQEGSNDGGWHKDEKGDLWYIKRYLNPFQAQTEYAALHLYESMGFAVPWAELVEGDEEGDVWLATKKLNGVKVYRRTPYPPEFMRTVFLPIVLLADRDWNKSWNHFYLGNKPAAIDAGGCLEFRAQGENKNYPPDPSDDLDSFPRYDDTGLYLNLTKKELQGSLDRVKGLSDSDILRAFRNTDIGHLTSIVGRRRDFLVAWAEAEIGE